MAGPARGCSCVCVSYLWLCLLQWMVWCRHINLHIFSHIRETSGHATMLPRCAPLRCALFLNLDLCNVREGTKVHHKLTDSITHSIYDCLISKSNAQPRVSQVIVLWVDFAWFVFDCSSRAYSICNYSPPGGSTHVSRWQKMYAIIKYIQY